MKALLAILAPAPLLAAITPAEIAALVVGVAFGAYVAHELFAEHFRQKKIRRDIERFFERRERDRRSIRL